MESEQSKTILAALEEIRKELRLLRRAIKGSKKPTYKAVTLTNHEWCYEYPSMTIDISAKNWKAIQLGKVMCLMGRGYDYEVGKLDEEEIYSQQDHWIFNESAAGSIEIVMTDEHAEHPDTAFIGGIENCDIAEQIKK